MNDDRRRNPASDEEGELFPELVIAAVERAALHSPPGRGGVPVWTVLEHLAIRRRTRRAARVLELLHVLEGDGELTAATIRGVRDPISDTSSSPAWSASGRATARQLATMHTGSRSVNASSGRPDAVGPLASMPSTTPSACRALS